MADYVLRFGALRNATTLSAVTLGLELVDVWTSELADETVLEDEFVIKKI